MRIFVCLLCCLIGIKSVGQSDNPAFPLSVSDNQCYLVNAQGYPFFYQADTPWLLSFKLSLDEVKEYMRVRKAQGFNVLQVMLTGEKGLKDVQGHL